MAPWSVDEQNDKLKCVQSDFNQTVQYIGTSNSCELLKKVIDYDVMALYENKQKYQICL